MRAFGLLGLLIMALLVGWAASRSLRAPVAAGSTVPITQVPQQVQSQVDAAVQLQADQQRKALEQAERGDSAK